MSPRKPIKTLRIFCQVSFSQRIKYESIKMRNTFDLCAITAFPTVVSMNHAIRRYILRAFAPEIVKNSNFVNLRCIFSHPWSIKIHPVTIKGTNKRKNVCWVCGSSRVFTKTPLSHQIVHAQMIASIGNIFLFFIFFFYYSTLQIHHSSIFFSEFQELLMCTSFYDFSLFEDDDIVGWFHCL